MEIIIPLPVCSSANSYKELKNHLHQLELAVHHAQKAVEASEKNGLLISEDSFVCYKHPSLESSLKLESKDKEQYSEEERALLENFPELFYDELQDVELQINLQ